MVAGAADMIRRRGLNGTSVRDLAKHSGAPLGSTYHYFPGGKYELAAEAVRWADDVITRSLTKHLEAGPVAGLRGLLDGWRMTLRDSDFRAGCPILAVAIEDPPEGETAPQQAAAVAFENWTALIAQSLRAHGAKRGEAQRVANLVVAAFEGALAMARAQRSVRPLDDIAAPLEKLMIDALGEAPSAKRPAGRRTTPRKATR
jgi:AcrR family transcriptional regulator